MDLHQWEMQYLPQEEQNIDQLTIGTSPALGTQQNIVSQQQEEE